jgi:thiamine-phosphate pyrophosphorylase
MSRSVHCISYLDTALSGWDYAFISPIFPSVSKVGYAAEWIEGELRAALASTSYRQLYALGGVTEDTCAACVDYGFKGAVLHGALWMSDCPIEQFKKIKEVSG